LNQCSWERARLPAFLASLDFVETETVTFIAERVLFVAPASRRLYYIAMQAYKTAGETPALHHCCGNSYGFAEFMRREFLARKSGKSLSQLVQSPNQRVAGLSF
jgi:hypothetical protein